MYYVCFSTLTGIVSICGQHANTSRMHASHLQVTTFSKILYIQTKANCGPPQKKIIAHHQPFPYHKVKRVKKVRKKVKKRLAQRATYFAVRRVLMYQLWRKNFAPICEIYLAHARQNAVLPLENCWEISRDLLFLVWGHWRGHWMCQVSITWHIGVNNTSYRY
jgi:hypothetical protein